MAINVSALTAYVDEQRLPLIRKAVLGPMTLKHIQTQYGVVGPTALNLLNTSIEFGDGSTCGYKDAGETAFSQRKLEPVILKVNKSFCDKTMANYWMNGEVKIAAGTATLPVEGQILESIVDGVGEALEKAIWADDTTIESAHLYGFLHYSGSMTQAQKDEASIYGSVKNVYKAIPAKSLKDTAIFVGLDTFRSLVMEITEKNLFHYDAKVDETFEIILPGTNTKVIGVEGLTGKNAIVALNTKHAFYGTDLANDNEVLDFWYSRDSQEFRSAINFTASTQVAYPDENVYCNLA